MVLRIKKSSMSDTDPTEDHRATNAAWSGKCARASSPAGGAVPFVEVVSFDRTELRVIFDLYGRKVAGGEWRDYAIDFCFDRAVFSIYRRSSEYALYRIEKNPKLARKQGLYSVITATGLILKRGPDLARVIAVLDKRLKLVSGDFDFGRSRNETAAASGLQPREPGSRAGAVTDAAPDGRTLAVQSRQFCRAQGRRNKRCLVEGEN